MLRGAILQAENLGIQLLGLLHRRQVNKPLGTPTRIVDMDTQEVRETTHQDMLEHIILINACENIHNSQMDVWPNDILMTTIHAEAIWAWAHNSRKPYGMGCYGYLPTWDMMRMMSIAVGGKAELTLRQSDQIIHLVLGSSGK